MEYWWNISIKTAIKIRHNKPDLIIWNHEKGVCIMYPNYKFEMIPVVIGCLGYDKNDHIKYIKQLGFDDKEIPFLMRRLQIASISGTVNICKVFFNFSDAK